MRKTSACRAGELRVARSHDAECFRTPASAKNGCWSDCPVHGSNSRQAVTQDNQAPGWNVAMIAKMEPTSMALATPLTLRTFTFLFTDIEDSTRLWEQQPELMHDQLARHDALLRRAIQAQGGRVFKTIGDAFCAAFPAALDAVRAAIAAQQALQQEVPRLRVRMAVHTGEAEARDEDYFGSALNRVARLLVAGHGARSCSPGRRWSSFGTACPMRRAYSPWGSTNFAIWPAKNRSIS